MHIKNRDFRNFFEVVWKSIQNFSEILLCFTHLCQVSGKQFLPLKQYLIIALCIVDTPSKFHKVVEGRFIFYIGLKQLAIQNFNQPGKNFNFPQIFQTFTENLFR